MIDRAITLFLVLIAFGLFTVRPLFAIASKPLFDSQLNQLLENVEKNFSKVKTLRTLLTQEKNENGIIFEGSHDKPHLMVLC